MADTAVKQRIRRMPAYDVALKEVQSVLFGLNYEADEVRLERDSDNDSPRVKFNIIAGKEHFTKTPLTVEGIDAWVSGFHACKNWFVTTGQAERVILLDEEGYKKQQSRSRDRDFEHAAPAPQVEQTAAKAQPQRRTEQGKDPKKVEAGRRAAFKRGFNVPGMVPQTAAKAQPERSSNARTNLRPRVGSDQPEGKKSGFRTPGRFLRR